MEWGLPPGRPSERRTDRGYGRDRAAARSRPQRRDGAYLGGNRIGSLLVIDPPANEIRPCLGRITLDREFDLAHSGDRVQVLLIAQADPPARVRLIRHLKSHRLRDPGEAQESRTQAETSGYNRR